MSQSSPTDVVPAWQFDLYVEAEADGTATTAELAVLGADRIGWAAALRRLLDEAQEFVATARSLPGDERDQVLADAQSDERRLSAAWARFNGAVPGVKQGGGREATDGSGARPNRAPGSVRLQASWRPGRVVVWGAGPRTPAADGDAVSALLAAAGAPTTGWVGHAAISLPDGVTADAFVAPVGDVLGWLVAVGAGQVGHDVGESVRWLGSVAVWAVELTARGAMVPLLRQRKRPQGTQSRSRSSFVVRWTPALIDARRLEKMADDVPGSVLACDASVDARALTRSALSGMVDAICRESAGSVEVAAPPPSVRTSNDVGEAFVGRLDGSAFDAPTRTAAELVTRLADWSSAR